MTSNGIQDILENLSEAEKKELKDRLGISINIFLCGSAAVNSGVSIQINDPDLAKAAIEKIPPESLAEILKAIADVVVKKEV